MIILDTNVTSELMRSRADASVLALLAAQDPEDLYSTAVTAAQITYGIERLPAGRRRTELQRHFLALAERDPDREFPFDGAAARVYGRIMAARRRRGTPMDVLDAQIASIAVSRGAVVATRNVADFRDCGLDVVDPWQGSAPAGPAAASQP